LSFPNFVLGDCVIIACDVDAVDSGVIIGVEECCNIDRGGIMYTGGGIMLVAHVVEHMFVHMVPFAFTHAYMSGNVLVSIHAVVDVNVGVNTESDVVANTGMGIGVCISENLGSNVGSFGDGHVDVGINIGAVVTVADVFNADVWTYSLPMRTYSLPVRT